MDSLAKEHRSWLMSKVKSKNTSPEVRVRKAAHAFGLRFRLHQKKLPGTPDLTFPKWKVALFVHGCFWHRHSNCAKASMPKSNVEFWEKKFQANLLRDEIVKNSLVSLGWNHEIIWECETKNAAQLQIRLNQIFSPVGERQ